VDVQREAGMGEADLLLAVTRDDNVTPDGGAGGAHALPCGRAPSLAFTNRRMPKRRRKTHNSSSACPTLLAGKSYRRASRSGSQTSQHLARIPARTAEGPSAPAL